MNEFDISVLEQERDYYNYNLNLLMSFYTHINRLQQDLALLKKNKFLKNRGMKQIAIKREISELYSAKNDFLKCVR